MKAHGSLQERGYAENLDVIQVQTAAYAGNGIFDTSHIGAVHEHMLPDVQRRGQHIVDPPVFGGFSLHRFRVEFKP